MAVYDDQDEEVRDQNPLTPDDVTLSPEERRQFEQLSSSYYNSEAEDLARREGLDSPLSDEHEDKTSDEQGSGKSLSPVALGAIEAGAAASDTLGKGFTGGEGPQSAGLTQAV